MIRQSASAATGTEPAVRLNWKLPTVPSATPSTNSMAYTPAPSSERSFMTPRIEGLGQRAPDT